ncbi:MAG: flagellar hook-associated protein FlgK [Pirellulales bacterium]
MSLFSSISQANNSLKASQIGLQVVGQNIANANTPGYTREEVVLAPAPTQKVGGLLLGMGVQVRGVVQKIDKFLDERLRSATSDRVGAEVQEQTYLTLESLMGELGDTDLSSSLTSFFGSLNDVVNQPEDVLVRGLAVQKGETLTQDINRLANRVRDERANVNAQVIRLADDVNRLTEEIRSLNVRIATAEGGDVSISDAVGLRDQRYVALQNLAELVDIKVTEQDSGTLTVFVGGQYLVFEGQRREVQVVSTNDRGMTVSEVQLADSQSPLNVTGGELGGLIAARDSVLGEFLDGFDQWTEALVFELNKVHSSGQGLTGYDSLTSEFGVDDVTTPLDEAGLPFLPASGSFQVLVQDKQTGETRTELIQVDLDGIGSDTTLADLATSLDAIDGVSTEITSAGKLKLSSESVNSQFSFADDTSGVLASLGINTFFGGSTALDIRVQDFLRDDPSKLAVSRGGIGEDSANAVELTAFADKPLESQRGVSVLVLYDRLVGEVTQGATIARSVAEGFRVFEQTLEGQRLATSGVSLDEEAVKMITLQRAYQATARYIATLAELLDVLVNL